MMDVSPTTSPYKGLVPYSEEDAQFFFGRDAEREIITANLISSRFTLLYGPSGVGKSSVLHAGVAHALRGRAEQSRLKRGAPEFVIVVFSSWRDDPAAGLGLQAADSVAHALGVPSVEDPPLSRLLSLADRLRSYSQLTEGGLLIILDQFEEYFVYHGQEEGEGTLAHELPRAIIQLDLDVNFLISIREDAMAKLDRFEGRIPNLFSNYLRIEHLDREAARAAIVKPIEQYNRLNPNQPPVRIEPELVESVLDQVKTGRVILGEAGRGAVEQRDVETQIETPYLQLVMTRLWDEEQQSVKTYSPSSSPTLRLETLNRLGGAERIVRTHLDTTMGALPPDEQDIAARVFHFLVTPSGTKIAHTAADLAQYAGLPEGNLEPTLVKLSSGSVRILRPVAPPLDRPTAPRYEIFHDVLAAPILDWRTRYIQSRERAAAEERQVRERAEAQRELAREKARVRRLRAVLIGVSLLLLAVVGLALYALQQRNAAAQAQSEASAQRDAADKAKTDSLSRELALTGISELASNPELSRLLVIEAARLNQNATTEDALRAVLLEPARAVLVGHTAPVIDVAPSPDGRWLITASTDGTSLVWSMATMSNVAQLQRDVANISGLKSAYSPDGSRFLLVSGVEIGVGGYAASSTASLYEVGSWRELAHLPIPAGMETSAVGAVFSPDGNRVIATGGWSIQIWDAHTFQSLLTLSGLNFQATSPSFHSVALSPDGRFFLTSHGNGAQLWETATGKQVAELQGHTGEVLSAAFSPDGRLIVTASADKTARVWDTQTARTVFTMTGHTDTVTGAIFSPDGRLVMTRSNDNTAGIWDAATGKNVAMLEGHTSEITGALFRPDGKLIITASKDGTIRLWDPQTGVSLAELAAPSNQPVLAAAFSPDGKFFVTGGEDEAATIWDTAVAAANVVEMRGHIGSVAAAVFSPDGKLVITASHDNTARLWDAATGRTLAQLGGHTAPVTSAVFSPDGRLALTTSEDSTARIWQVPAGTSVAVLKGHKAAIRSGAFSPDGKMVATAGDDHTARIWEATTGRLVAEFQGHTDPINSVAFSPDGKWVLTAGSQMVQVREANGGRLISSLQHYASTAIPTQSSGAAFSPDGRLVLTLGEPELRLWEASSGRQVMVLAGHTGPINRAVFSPDGKYILTASDDDTARLWDAATGQTVMVLRGHGGPVETVAWSADGKFAVTGSSDATVRIWDMTSGRALAELHGHSATVNSVMFSPDERSVLSASEDDTARLFPCELCLSFDDLVALARTRVDREMTCEERDTYLHEHTVCPAPTATPTEQH